MQGFLSKFLDVTVTLRGNSICYKHYDKRDDIPAFVNARPFPDIGALLSESYKFSVYTSALHRINNSSSTKTAFIRRAIKYGSRMIKSGYDAHKIVGRVQAFSRFDPTKGDWLTVRSKITRGLLTP